MCYVNIENIAQFEQQVWYLEYVMHEEGASQMVLVVKNLLANAGDTGDAGLIPGLRRSPGVGNGNPLQNSYLENSMGRGAQWATGHGVTKSRTRLRDCAHTHVRRVLVSGNCHCEFGLLRGPR